jgi:hypothetical protein
VLPLRYEPYDSLGGVANVVVDGSAAPGTRLVLSHWPGSATPPELRADLSAEIALAALDRPELFAGVEVVSNNHFDQDGLMSLYALVDPEGATARREVVVDVARAGDFGWYQSRDAARIAIAIATLSDPAVSPLDAGIFAGDAVGALYHECLDRLPELLDDVKSSRALWELEDAHLAESEAAIADGTVTVEDHPASDLAIVRVPEGWAARRAHRFTQTWSAVVHPMAVNGATSCLRVLVLQGARARLECRYETWVQLVSRPVRGRPDLRELAAVLDQAEGAPRWRADPPGALAPALTVVDGAASSLPPERLVELISGWLATAPSAWDPFAPT